VTVWVTGWLLPRPLPAIRVTLCGPSCEKVTFGLWIGAVDGLPFWKLQFQEVGWPIVRSVNWTGEPR
jgi:hypothetical protein